MSIAAGRQVIHALRRVAAAPAGDAELLTRFVDTRDEAAFAAIVERHGPLVLGTCRRMLGNAADADDAFQAVFLALARNAGRVRRRAALAAWLYGAACLVCLKLRRRRARSQSISLPGAHSPALDPLEQISARELVAALDDEVARLPEHFQLPVVLCLVEGLTQGEAAARLGWSAGSVKGRLERGRERLRRRLAARGLTLAAALSATVLGRADAVPPLLVRRAVELVNGGTAPEMIARLAATALPSSAALCRTATALMLGAVLVAAAAGLGSEKPEEAPVKPAPSPSAAKPRVDRFGDPLPDGAVMRLGTVRFRAPGVRSVAFRPSGELVAACEDRTVYVWPTGGSSRPASFSLPWGDNSGGRVTLSPDARFAAARLRAKFVVWDLSGAQPVVYLTRDMSDASTECFSHDGRWLAVNDTTRGQEKLLLCDLPSKSWAELPFRKTRNDTFAQSLSFTPDGKSLVVVVYDTVSIVDTASRRERFTTRMSGKRPLFAALSPGGDYLAVTTNARVELLPVPAADRMNGLTAAPKWARWVGFTKDGKNLLLGDIHGIHEWDTAGGQVVREFKGPAESVAAVSSPDGRWLASNNDYAISLWDARTGRLVRPELHDAGHTGAVLNVTVSPDGRLVTTCSPDNEFRVWAADTGKELCRFRCRWAYVSPVVFLPGSKSLIAVADDSVTPVVIDAATGKELRRFAVPAEMARSERTMITRLSPNAKTLTTTSANTKSEQKVHSVRWDLADGRIIERTELPAEIGRRPEMGLGAFSPDGQWYVTLGMAMRIGGSERIHLVPDGRADLLPHAFSNDSRLVAVGRLLYAAAGGFDTEQGRVVVFDLVRQTKVVEVPSPPHPRAVLSADGRLLGVSGRGEVAVWELASGRPVRRFVGGEAIKRSRDANQATTESAEVSRSVRFG